MSGLFLLSCWPLATAASESAEASLRGRVIDAAAGVGLPGATIALLGTEFGGHTDEKGRFELQGLPAGRYDLLVSFVGYRSQRLQKVLAGTEEELKISLAAAAIEFPDLVISAIRRPQAFAEAPVSISVASAREISTHNAFSLTGPLRKVSGVNQVGSQINIRGSSGYSRGTGSRVLLLLDGFPMLAADLGDIKWDVIPVDQVERMEVIKGAGSALYGTGALGGVINVITRNPSEKPQTRLRLVSGFYSQPAYKAWRWTDDLMYLAGVDLSHSRTIGRTGLVVAGGHKRGTGYHENDDYHRYNLYSKVVHRFSPTTYWRTTASWAMDDHGVFIQWKERTEPLAVPDGDEEANTVSWKFNLNSELRHLHSRDLGYRLKTSYYRTSFKNTQDAGGLTSNGHKLGWEFQADYAGWERVDLTLGTAVTYDLVSSPGDFLGERSMLNLGLYGQGVYQPLAELEVAVGLRYDWHRRSREEEESEKAPELCPLVGASGEQMEHQFSPQVGLSYQLRPGTALRASVGRGFRAPSVSEVNYQAQVSGIQVCPNPALEAEGSWSFEAGVKQWVGDFMAVDLALFWNRYEGLIEARAKLLDGGATPVAQFRNLSRARIRGLEVEQQVALPYGLRWRTAYTFLDAVEFLGKDEVLPPYCQQGITPGEEAPLPYRARHLLNTGPVAMWGKTQIGANFQYMSRFERVSGLFPECDRDHIPIYLVDAFVSHRRGGLQFNLRVNNLLQYHYVLTERKIRAPRQVSLAISGMI